MSMKSISLFFGLIIVQVCATKAQFLSLQKTEIQKLSLLIEKDKSANQLYQRMVNTANTALAQEPNPIDTIVSEGHLITDPKKIRTQQSLADMNKIYALAITYIISHKAAYKQKCIDYLLAWANVNHGNGNPINDTKLDPVMEAYDLLKDEMPEQARKTVNTWLMQIADAEIGNPRFWTTAATASNNWNSHRIKVVGNVAYILNNKAYKDFTDTTLKKQIQKNLNPDGSGVDLEERDALHYHVYTLEPLLKIIIVIKRANGINFFNYQSPEGSSIQKSTAFLIPYVKGTAVHHEYVNSKVAFDKKRADNHEPGFTIGATFKPEAAVDVLSFAAFFDPAYSNLINEVMHSENKYPNWQALLNEVIRK